MRWESRRKAAGGRSEGEGPTNGPGVLPRHSGRRREDSRKGGVLAGARPRRPAGLSVLYPLRRGWWEERRRVRDEAAGFAFHTS